MMSIMELHKEMRIPNNYRKIHGKHTMRWKHINKAVYKRCKNTQMDVNSLYPTSVLFSVSLEEVAKSFSKFAEAVKDFAEGMKDEH